jgi:hypothetical protein
VGGGWSNLPGNAFGWGLVSLLGGVGYESASIKNSLVHECFFILIYFLKHVSNTAGGQDQFRVTDVVLELGPKAADVDIDNTGIDSVVSRIRPNVL